MVRYYNPICGGPGLITQYINQLNSGDAMRRREAIIALGKSGDAAALKPLAEVYRNDPDPTLRELALKAGKYLRQQTGGTTTPSTPPPARRPVTSIQDEIDEYEAQENPTKPQIKVQRRDVRPEDAKRAREYTNEALTQNINGDNAKAIKALRNAIKIDPNIIDDAFFTSVAGTVTGEAGEDAIAMILDDGQAKSIAHQSNQQKRQKRIDTQMETARESTWGGVGLEAAIYFAINVIGVLVLGLVSIELIKNALNNPETIAALQLDRAMRNSLESFTALGGAIVFIGALVYAVLQLVYIFMYGGLVHVVARYLFRGTGTIVHFLDKFIGFYNKRLPIYFGLLLIANLFTFGAGAPILGACLSIIVGIFTLWFLFEHIGVTAKSYDFGTASGCLSHLLVYIALTVVFGVLGLAFSTAIGTALTNAMAGV
jgi:tetratricopeptide (TPR) repeat protein